MEDKKNNPPHQFGPFHLYPSEGILMRGRELVPLTVKAFDILRLLIENRGHVLTKESLIRSVWPDCFVEENNLTQNISTLRRALGEDPDQPRYIETVPRRGYRFIAEVTPLAVAPPALPLPHEPNPKVLAILPFRCIGSECPAFWGLGMADALITQLSNLDQIRVRPSASIVRYDGVAVDWATAGRELKTETLLSGCIQRSGDRVRVTVQLVSTESGHILWAGQFDESFTDIFAVEDSISRQVARTLVHKLSGDQSRRLAKRYTESPGAQQAYLNGRYYWNQRSVEGLHKSIRCFQEAIAIDPGHALAYVGLADAFSQLGGYSDLPASESYPRARAAALRALEIDDSLAEAHIPLADVLMYYDYDFDSASHEYRRAIDLRPDYATGHHLYSWYLIATGRFTEAYKEMSRAQDLDLLSPVITSQLGLPLYFARDFQRAVRHFEQAVELNPTFSPAYVYLGRAYLQCARYDEAIAALNKATELSPNRTIVTATLGHILGASGHTQEARAILTSLTETAQRRYVSPCYLAMVASALGDTEHAFSLLQQAVENRSNPVLLAAIDPVWDPLRPTPRFRELASRVSFH